MLGVSRPISILSSKKTSDLARLFSGMSTEKGLILANEISLSRIFTGGYMEARGEEISNGSQSGHLSIAFTRSVIDSEMMENSEGPGVPPNVKRKHNKNIQEP